MFFNKNVRIVVKNKNLAIEAKAGSNLYNVLVSEKAIPATLCRGNGLCGKCKVHITQNNIAKPNKKERHVLARINLEAGFRLACQAIVKDDMVVDTTEITAPPSDMVIKTVTREQAAVKPELLTNDLTSDQPAPSVAKVLPHTLKNPDTTVVAKVRETDKNARTDGILLVHHKKQFRFFVYSAAIDNIAQEGAVNAQSPMVYIENGTLTDYIHDELKIKDIDRIIILSDEPSAEGENLFDIVSYKPFDIGATPCELIRPLPEIGDLSLFLRFFSVTGKKRLMISLDRLDYSHYFSEDNIVKIPNRLSLPCNNLLNLVSAGNNPVVNISNDLRTITTAKHYGAPDSLPLPVLMKVTACMVEKKLADNEFKIYSRSDIDPSVSLEYVIKVTQYEGNSAFYLYRDKESSLMITQQMLSALAAAKQFVHYAVDYTESNLGNIESILISTPVQMNNLMEGVSAISLVPKRHENSMLYKCGDSSVNAVKLFQKSDVRSYIQQYFGGFIKSG